MIITLYTSPRVKVGSAQYREEMLKAQRIAAQSRQAGKGGCDRWVDEYNDYSAAGRFMVTGRS
jgi:hypothetical protein